MVVIEKKGEDYTIYTTENKKQKLSQNDFLKKFTGIIVAVEQSEKSSQTKTNSNTTKIVCGKYFNNFSCFCGC